MVLLLGGKRRVEASVPLSSQAPAGSRRCGSRNAPSIPSLCKKPATARSQHMPQQAKPLAVVTGASTGIGYHLAKCCAGNGLDLVVVADETEIHQAAKDFEAQGAKVEALEADL